MSEIERLKEAYARRTERGLHLLYDPFAPANYMIGRCGRPGNPWERLTAVVDSRCFGPT